MFLFDLNQHLSQSFGLIARIIEQFVLICLEALVKLRYNKNENTQISLHQTGSCIKDNEMMINAK